jgi:ankyrin repeat protein
MILMHSLRPMHRAAGEGHVDVLKVLAELGANVNSPGLLGVRPLHCAAGEGRVEAVKVLVELGADKNAPQDVHGLTPLHTAAGYGKVEVVNVLVMLGANKEAKDVNGHTPLHRTAQLGQVEALKALVLLGADKEAKDDDGWTPLHWVAQSGHLETVKALMQSGVDIEAKRGAGLTPLHIAAGAGHVETVKALVEAGADKEAKADDGLTALHWAASQRQEQVYRLLAKLGAETNVTLAQMLYPLIYHPAKFIYRCAPFHQVTLRRRGTGATITWSMLTSNASACRLLRAYAYTVVAVAFVDFAFNNFSLCSAMLRALLTLMPYVLCGGIMVLVASIANGPLAIPIPARSSGEASSSQGGSGPSTLPPESASLRSTAEDAVQATPPSAAAASGTRQTDHEPAGGGKKDKERQRKERQRQRKLDVARESLQWAIDAMAEHGARCVRSHARCAFVFLPTHRSDVLTRVCGGV